MLIQKSKILDRISYFNYNTTTYANKINDTKDKMNKTLDKYLVSLKLIHNKLIYYNGYNINTRYIPYSTQILPHNII